MPRAPFDNPKDHGAATVETPRTRSIRRPILFEDMHWPLLLVRFIGTPTDSEFEQYLDQMTSMLARGERHAVILDASAAHFTPISQHRLQAQWIRAHRTKLEELSAGTAFVFSSRLFRVVVAGVFMLQPLPTPHAVFATLADATRWAAAQLGIEPPVSSLAWGIEETTRKTPKQ